MDVSEAIKKRRSIRKFKPDPIPEEKIRLLLESARLAPSGTNTQPWRFVVIKDNDTKKKLQALKLIVIGSGFAQFSEYE